MMYQNKIQQNYNRIPDTLGKDVITRRIVLNLKKFAKQHFYMQSKRIFNNRLTDNIN